jgi:hypothetical protein
MEPRIFEEERRFDLEAMGRGADGHDGTSFRISRVPPSTATNWRSRGVVEGDKT